MKVILLTSVPKVGIKDTIVDVAAGYAEHALFPRKLAVPATDAAIAVLNRRKQNIVAEKNIQHTLLDKAIAAANDLALVMSVRANKEGSLFSKIHTKDVTEFLMKNHRISIDPKLMTIPDESIKKIGTYQITVVDGEYKATFQIELRAV